MTLEDLGSLGELLGAWREEFRRMVRQPGMRRWWQANRSQFTPRFQELVESLVEET